MFYMNNSQDDFTWKNFGNCVSSYTVVPKASAPLCLEIVLWLNHLWCSSAATLIYYKHTTVIPKVSVLMVKNKVHTRNDEY